jgi:RND family efflux transporter MFP subunit
MPDTILSLPLLPARRAIAHPGSAGAGIVLLALAMAFSACTQEGPAAAEASLAVRTERVGHAGALTTRRFAGRVDAVRTVDLAFEVGGRIVALPVKPGSFIPKGALVAALDPGDFELAVREAEVQRDLASKELERHRSLLARDSVSRAAFDRTEAEYRLRVVALDQALRNLAYASLEAPFDALVTRRLIDAFSSVQPKQDVVRVQDVTELRIHVHVPEHLIRLATDPERIRAEATFPFAPDTPFPLAYREHETEADGVAQTYRVTFGFPRPDDLSILPGMTASVVTRLMDASANEAVDVPLSAVDTSSDGAFRVWVIDPDTQTVAPRGVTLGPVTNDRALVREGLRPGETIVSAGTRLLRDGARVYPVEPF